MNNKAVESRTIKTIVPIKGNLLEKIKNKIKNKDNNSQAILSGDVSKNNNKESTNASSRSVSKIQIQKIEKVNLPINELIKSSKSEIITSTQKIQLEKVPPKEPDTQELEKCVSSIVYPANKTIETPATNSLIDHKDISQLNDDDWTSKTFDQADEYEEMERADAIDNDESDEVDDEGDCMDIGDETWLHDINVMIGVPRIREIDMSLKKIPTVVTGNRIQTENVELKLIINHLLGKLNAKSVIETMEEAEKSGKLPDYKKDTLQSLDDNSDSFDMPSGFQDSDDDNDQNIVVPIATEKDDEKIVPTTTEQQDVNILVPSTTEQSNEDIESKTSQNSFSVPLENSIAIVTIPDVQPQSSILEMEKPDSHEADTHAADKAESHDTKVPETHATKNPPSNNSKTLESESNLKSIVSIVKKRRGRPPLATSASKKMKTTPKTVPKKEQTIDAVAHPRKLSLRGSSRESSVESNTGATSTRSNSKSPLRESINESPKVSRETMLKTAIAKDIESKINKKDAKKGLDAPKRTKTTKIKSSESSSECENGKNPKNVKNISSSNKNRKLLKKQSTDASTVNCSTDPAKQVNGQRRRKCKILSSQSDSDSQCEKNSELKSATILSDFHSQHNNSIQSSIIERYDYLNKPSLSSDAKNIISELPICAELSEIIAKCKEADPTYVKPPEFEKRPYLKTSAFTGNHVINTDDSSHTRTVDSCKRPSASRGDSSLLSSSDNNYDDNNSKNNNSNNIDDNSNNNNNIANTNNNNNNNTNTNKNNNTHTQNNDSTLEIKKAMKNLIKQQKDKIQAKSISIENSSPPEQQQTPPKKELSAKKGRPTKSLEIDVTKRNFSQQPVEAAIERLVCYDEILEAIRITDPPRRNGRASSAVKPLELAKRAEIELKLKSLDAFTCGNCKNLVTKHKWIDHVIDHGGLAWLESFETPIDISDWNESVRKLNNYLRIYKLEFFRCPNCNLDKKSALGHLSHIYVCGESEETIESRKVECKYCSEKVLPYYVSFHRSKCKVLCPKKEKEKPIQAEDGDDEDEDMDDNNSKSSSATRDSGRVKRKAGKKAVKKFKTFLDRLKDDPLDHMLIGANGHLICNYCDERFSDQTKSKEHLEKFHADKKEGLDFEASSSDATINENESSETDGSCSGVESSEIQSVDEDLDQFDSINVSNSKGRQPTYDSQEIKNGRKLVVPFIESIQAAKNSKRTVKLNKELIEDNLCDNILAGFAPKYKINRNINLATYLSSSKFQHKSMKFTIKMCDYYSLEFGKVVKSEWMELDAGNNVADKNSLTLYCGGAISSLDWSQCSPDGKNFLAVACNSANNKSLDLEETSKTCIQLYQMENLVNEKCTTFENSCKLLYFFSICEGPVWSIKFHPFVIPTNERIGLLAVTSSNHHVYIFSLPYLKNIKSPQHISLEPSFECKTVDEVWLYQDKYLMQATYVNWFYRKEHELHLLGAGFINGSVTLWSFDEDLENGDESTTLYPYMTFQPHREPITGLDFKHTIGSEIHLLTSSLDRDIKVFIIDNNNIQEISAHHGSSRVLCAEWWNHWPGYIQGNDNCYAHGNVTHRQPLEFAGRYLQLFFVVSSITGCSINHWLNAALFSTDSGDILSTIPLQLINASPKDRWTYYSNNVISYLDIVNLEPNSDEVGVVFCDLKSKVLKRPKEFRTPPSTDHIHQLQINQIAFNRNEMSYRFYALAYETGFVRIRHLKNSK